MDQRATVGCAGAWRTCAGILGVGGFNGGLRGCHARWAARWSESLALARPLPNEATSAFPAGLPTVGTFVRGLTVARGG